MHGVDQGPGLANAKNKADNITKTAKSLHLRSVLTFYSTPANLAAHTLNIDCLAASDGVCTKRKTAWFGLLLFKNKVNNNSQTRPFIHLTSLVTFYSRTLLLK